MQRQKTKCHALLHLASELALCEPAGTEVMRAAGVAPAVITTFESAWRVGSCSQAAVPSPMLPDPAADLAAPFAFIQDHQSRELALDTLLLLSSRPLSLQLLGEPSPTDGAQGASTAATADHQPGGGSQTSQVQSMDHSSPRDASDAEAAALSRLLQLVRDLLGHSSAAHLRAGIAILGHVQFAGCQGGCQGSAVTTAQQSSGSASEGGCIHLQWMQLLCDVFDAAWASDRKDDGPEPSPRSDQQPQPSELWQQQQQQQQQQQPGSAPFFLFHPQDGPSSSSGAQAQAPGFAGLMVQVGSTDTAQPGAAAQGGSSNGNGEQPLLQLELGLGYRVLVQVRWGAACLCAWPCCSF